MLQAEGWGAEGAVECVEEDRGSGCSLVGLVCRSMLLCKRLHGSVMPLRHGQKVYCQLLLDMNRYKLAEELAAQEGKKVTGMLREMVYMALEKALPASDYKAAEAADRAAWAESVQRRVQGRMRSKQQPGESERDA